ncbi:hypothetical protein [Natrononativus amylolyticus]|uniref:hypothetical protein n=1 Tax=Natrononativus amylolyticus TaxID=2963434 RepID=UPI0020CD9979|nr:hypothetical protein [Natrononativus amylolyticus]
MRRRRYLLGVGAGVGGLVLGRERIATADAETISVSIVETNDPIEAGEFLEIVGEVENAGADEVQADLELLVGGEPTAARRSFGLEAGETRTVEFHHRTYPVRRDSTFPVGIAGPDGTAERTVEVYGIGELAVEAVRPETPLTVQPGSTVLFEVAPDDLGEFGGRTHWYLDGAYAGHSSGPWFAAYALAQGADFWRHTFETSGETTVTAVVVGEDENTTARWSVDVADDGAAAPTIDDASPDFGPIDASESSSVELELAVSDPAGGLDRVVWWLEQADRVLDVSDVDGSEDTATLSVDGGELCHTCAVVPWVISESGLVTEASGWTANRAFDGDLEVTIAETNDPVEAGSVLEATVDVENRGASAASQELRLEVGGEVVDSESVDLEGGETDRLSLGYETYPVRQDVRFPIRVVCEDDSDTRTVDVFAGDVGSTRVRILETNAPVGAGEFLEVVAELEHVGEATVTRAVHLVAGDRVDTAEETLSPGETTTMTLGYETYPVRRDVEFPVVVETADYRDTRTFRVFADGVPSFRVTGLEADDPVDAGEFLEVVATLENAAEGERTDEVRLVVGGEVVDSTDATIGGGDTAAVELGYETYPVRQDVSFPVTVATDADDAAVTVDVLADGDDDPDLEVEFESCRRAVVTGAFDDGETLSANTGFYDLAGYGNTVGEDWLTVGDHVEAPFEGTVVFEVGEDDGVSVDGDEAVVTVRESGQFGTAISGVRTPDAEGVVGANHENPHDCLDEIRPEPPELSVADVAPLEDGDLEVTFEAANPTDVDIPVESAFVGATTDEPPAELEAGTTAATAEWTPDSGDERLAWEVDFSRFEYEEPIRAETEPAETYLPEADLAVSVVDANDPVDAGEVLEVTAEVTNDGASEVTETLRLVVGDEAVDTASVTVAGGETETVSLGYRTATVARDVQFTVVVEGETDSDERTVDVRGGQPEDGDETDEADPPANDDPSENGDPPDGDETQGDDPPDETTADPPENDEPADSGDGDGSADETAPPDGETETGADNDSG